MKHQYDREYSEVLSELSDRGLLTQFACNMDSSQDENPRIAASSRQCVRLIKDEMWRRGMPRDKYKRMYREGTLCDYIAKSRD